MNITRSDDLYKREGSDEQDDYVCADHLQELQWSRSPFAVGTWTYTLATGKRCWIALLESGLRSYRPHRWLPVTMFVLTQAGEENWQLFEDEAHAEAHLLAYPEAFAPVAATIFRSDPRLFR